MVDARQISRVLDHAATHDAKVILLADPDQLKPIGPGDAYCGLLKQHAPARLEAIRRQAEPWQRETSENLAGSPGRIGATLRAVGHLGAGWPGWCGRLEGDGGGCDEAQQARTR